MSKIPTDLIKHALNGATMGTHWSALFFAPANVDPVPIQTALAKSVDLVDQQMSTWKPDSDLMRLNRAPAGAWLDVPPELMDVLTQALEIGRLSDGAFDIGMGDAVRAWGFGAQDTDSAAIHTALAQPRLPAHELLQFDPNAPKLRKIGAIDIDLSGIAKGYAVDQMIKTLATFGITDTLVGLDGELRGHGRRPDGQLWTVAVEKPDYETRSPHSIIELDDSAIATSGDYRHWVNLGPLRLSHTMDPNRGGPLLQSPASVTVLAQSCMDADAWATALMVAGREKGAALAETQGLTALFIDRDGESVR